MEDKDTSAQKKSIAARGGMLQQIMDIVSVGIGLVDMSGCVTHANRRMAEMFGRSLEELAGCEYVELVHPSEREAARKSMSALLASETPAVDLERRYMRKDGTEFWGHLACRRFHDARGNELGIIGVITDISVRKQVEESLRESEQKYKLLIEATNTGYVIMDEKGRVLDANREYVRMTGRSRLADLLGQPVTEWTASYDLERNAAEVSKCMESGAVRNLVIDYVDAQGRTTPVEINATVLPGPPSARIFTVCRDITERRRSEAALKRSEARYRMLYEGTPVMMHSIDAEGRLISVSDQWLQQLGYTRDQVLGRRSTEFLDEQSRTYAQTVVLPDFMRTGICSDVPYTFLKKNGEKISTLLSAIAERDEAGKVVRSLAVIVDVTERKRAEQELRESEERFRAITMTASDAILLMDDKGTIVYWNPAAQRIFGYSSDEVVGRELHVLLAPTRMQGRYRQGFARFVTTGEGPVINRSVEMVALRKDGTEFPIEVSTSAMNIGERWHALGIVRDITERKQLEQELLKSEKLESIGTLAGGIAHDFNNLLQGVFGFISMARLTFDQREESLAMLAQAEKALHQSVNLTSQLLTFSKGGKPVKKVLDLRPLIENSLAFALSGSRITHEIVAAADLRAVEADEGQIGQVIQNIVLNADQAMPLGGTIRVALRNTTAAAIVPPADLQGDLVEISIRDQGTGIPAEYLTRIFDPYFTTKEKGSGLGLATSYSIVKNHGGLVRVQSEVGTGTTFCIYLPASDARAEEKNRAVDPAAKRGGRILVLDDEEMVRTVACRMLTALGHEVAATETGETALAAYRTARAAGRPFDVVMLDLTIRGGMGGIETLCKLVEIDPDVKAVVSSGYSDDAVLSNFRELGFRAFLKKPYQLQELQNIISALLDRMDGGAAQAEATGRTGR